MTTRSVTLWGVSDPKTCLKCGKLDSFFYLQSRDTHLTKANLRTSHGKTAGGVGGLLGALQIPGYLLNAVNIFGTHWQTTQWPFRLPASATETMSIHKRVIKHGVPPKNGTIENEYTGIGFSSILIVGLTMTSQKGFSVAFGPPHLAPCH